MLHKRKDDQIMLLWECCVQWLALGRTNGCMVFVLFFFFTMKNCSGNPRPNFCNEIVLWQKIKLIRYLYTSSLGLFNFPNVKKIIILLLWF